jgi:putative transcriptional regulator
MALEPPSRLRILLGYAGWGPGQLESELAQGAWLAAPVSREVVFDVEAARKGACAARHGIEPAT